VFVVGSVTGITCLDNRLYLVKHECNNSVFFNHSQSIHVFTADTLCEVSVIKVSGLYGVIDIVACPDDHQLFMIDRLSAIWRVSAENPTDYERWLTVESLQRLDTEMLTIVFFRFAGVVDGATAAAGSEADAVVDVTADAELDHFVAEVTTSIGDVTAVS